MSRPRRVPTATALAATLVLGACAASARAPSARGCPVASVEIVVTVDQWGDIVRSLAGPCGRVVSIVTSSSGDPHDYEPTPADGAVFAKAQMVVKNGLQYDAWADKAIAALAHRPIVVDAGRVVGAKDGDNPHLWYGPDIVARVADAVTEALTNAAPTAAAFFAAQHGAWLIATQSYRDAVARARATATGKSYAATEPVFDLMAAAIGMTDTTPNGFRRAAANGSDPAPADVAAFEKVLDQHKVAVLIYNVQTQGAIPEQIRKKAQNAKIPVVEVTETVKSGATGFVNWQLAQLDALTGALR